MDALLKNIQLQNLDLPRLAIIGGVLLLGTFLLSVIGRFAFGKRSVLNNAVSSAIGILFIYAITVVLKSSGAQFENWIAPLPFITISGNEIHFLVFKGIHYTKLCSEILNMIILAFLVNLADNWLPKGKNLLSWLFFRCMTVVLAFFLHILVVGLLETYLPIEIVTYAPVILLAILVLLLLTGALKIVVGAALTTVNPIIGGLYTFFFATIIGKQLTRSVLTTLIIGALVYLLNYLGCTVITIASAALIAYIPFVILLVVIWYIVYRVF